MRDPLEALDMVIGNVSLLGHVYDRLPPGGAITKQAPEVREALRRLSSHMTQTQRLAPWMCNPYWDPNPIVRFAAEWDRKMHLARWGWPATT